MKNPIKQILQSQSPAGVKVVALSLMLLLACAAPIMLYSLLGPEEGNPVLLGWLFAGGAVIAHLGFITGILLIIRDLFFSKK